MNAKSIVGALLIAAGTLLFAAGGIAFRELGYRPWVAFGFLSQDSRLPVWPLLITGLLSTGLILVVIGARRR